eukprot:s359_g11.t1
MQSSTIRMHACSEVYQTAWQCYCNPSLASTLVTLSDEDALAERRRAPAECMHLWRAVSSTSLSLRSLQELSFTDSFIACDRADPKAVTREAYLNMVNIFADLVLATNADLSEQQVEGDKSESLANSLLKAWNMDENLYKHILDSIYIWSSDRCPGAMKAAE